MHARFADVNQSAYEIMGLPVITWNQRSDWINVKMAGAVGNGVADDTAAIQGVFNSATANQQYNVGRTFYFPAGTYRITSTLELSNLYDAAFVGTGATSVLKWDGASGGILYKSNGNPNMSYDGIVFNGNDVAAVGEQYVYNTTDSQYYGALINNHNVEWENFTDSAVKIPEAASEILYSNTIFKHNGIGINLDQFNDYDNKVEDSAFIDNGYGVYSPYGNVDVTRSNFYHSTMADLELGAHSHRISLSTSIGSHIFVSTSQANNEGNRVVIQDCRVDSWTNAGGAVSNYSIGPISIIDTDFTNGPAGGPAIGTYNGFAPSYEIFILSNDKIDGSGNVSLLYHQPIDVRGRAIDVPLTYAIPATISLSDIFLNSSPISDKPVIDVSTYGASDNHDDTAAINAAIAAAKAANNGSIVYLPFSRYKLSSTVSLTGGNYSVEGAGGGTSIHWIGSPTGGPFFSVQDPQGLTLGRMEMLDGPDAVCRVAQTPGVNAGLGSAMHYDDLSLSTSDLTDPGQTSGISQTRAQCGLSLSNLPTGTVVRMSWSTGELRVNNSSAATVLAESWAGVYSVSGATAGRNGFLGSTFAFDGFNVYDIKVADNQNLTVSYFYTETTQRLLQATGNASLPPGRITIGGARILPYDNEGVSIRNYMGRIGLLHAFVDQHGSSPAELALSSPDKSDCGTPALQDAFCSVGTAPVKLSLIGLSFFQPEISNNLPAVIAGSNLRQIRAGNNWAAYGDSSTLVDTVTDTAASDDLRELSETFNDLRELRDLDLKLNGLHPASASARFYLDAGMKNIGNMTGVSMSVYDASTNSLVKQLSGLATMANGEIVLDQPDQLSGLDDAKTYTVLVDAPFFLTKKLSGVQRILTMPQIMPAGSPLVAGDANRNGSIDISDIVSFIRYFNATVSDSEIPAYRIMNEQVSLPNLVTEINTFQTRPHGDTLSGP